MKKTVYVDNNATTKVSPEVLQEMLPYFSELYGNPSSIHNFGGQISKKISEAKVKIGDLLGVKDIDEIIITSCGSESDNTAINAALKSQPNKKHIITSCVEHPAVLSYCKYLEKRGYEVTYISVNEKGQLNLSELENSLREDTAIVSIMWANNETGTVFPIKKIVEIVKQKNILFHTDAVQAVGKIDVNLSEIPIDMLSISGHKIHAPKGIGVLYVRKKSLFHPFLIGGHQESGRRAGTENSASIIGLGKAAELAKEYMNYENTEVKKLRDDLQTYIETNIADIKVNGDLESRLPNTLNVSFRGAEGEAILLYLDHLGICASSGSACTTGSLEPSHVLLSMNLSYEYAHGSIRFSLSKYNTQEEIDYIKEHISGVIKKLRDMSPIY